MFFFSKEFSVLALFVSLGGATVLAAAAVKNWYHTIMVLMIMEMMMIINFFLISSLALQSLAAPTMFMFATFMVIEASLGMSILTMVVRSHGSDYLFVFLGGS